MDKIIQRLTETKAFHAYTTAVRAKNTMDLLQEIIDELKELG